MNTQTWNLGSFNSLAEYLEVPNGGTIVVAGAYKGDYLIYLSERFPKAWLYGYEPQEEAFTVAKERLGEKAMLVNRALGTATRLAEVGNYGSDGCSVYAGGIGRRSVQMLNVAEALTSGLGSMVDLLVLNVEGGEWSLLPYMLDEMMHHRIASIALQQHTKYASKERIARVKSYLAEYYDLLYTDNQLDGWEFWRRK